MSCDERMHQRHSLGLVRLSVQLIEKRLFETEFANEILVAFHERPEYVGSLQEGLIAVSAWINPPRRTSAPPPRPAPG